MMAAEMKWSYDIVYLIYEITKRGAVTKQKKAKNSDTEQKKVFSGRQLGLVQEETLVVLYTHATGDREDNVGWSGETQEKSHPEREYSSVPKVKETDWRKSLNSLKASPVTEAENSLSMVGKMKIFVVWLSTSSRVSRCIHGYRRSCRQADGKSNLSTRSRRRYSRSSCYSNGKKSPRLCISGLRSNEVYSTESWRTGIERFGGTPENSQEAPGTKLNPGKKKAIWRHYPKRWISWAKSLRAQFWEETPEGTSRQADCTSRVAWNLARKYASSKPKTTTFYSPVKAPETQNIVCLMLIRELQCTMLSKGDSSTETMDTLRRSKTP